MQRSSERILTTHPGRLPDPDIQAELRAARAAGDQQAFDAQVTAGIAQMVRRQQQIGVDLLSDGEFWKARDQRYYDSRASGIETRPSQPGEPATVHVFQRERHTPDFRAFWEIYDRVGNTPMPGAELRGLGLQSQRTAISAPLTPRPADGASTIAHEVAVSKAAMTAAGARIEDCFFPVLSPNWLSHFVMNDYYKSEEEFIYPLAAFFKNDYRAVVDAGFILQIDDPALVTRYGMIMPAPSIAEYRTFVQPRLEALNWALEGIPEDRVRYHTCWGSWHTPHTTDIPFEHVIDLMFTVKAAAYSVETADVRHELDWHVWETHKLPEGKVFIPGVIAHKTTTIEPPELVAERIVRYAKLMGRENVIAGVDCGLGGRCYPDIGWAKLRSLVEGAALASKQLWK